LKQKEIEQAQFEMYEAVEKLKEFDCDQIEASLTPSSYDSQAYSSVPQQTTPFAHQPSDDLSDDEWVSKDETRLASVYTTHFTSSKGKLSFEEDEEKSSYPQRRLSDERSETHKLSGSFEDYTLVEYQPSSKSNKLMRLNTQKHNMDFDEGRVDF